MESMTIGGSNIIQETRIVVVGIEGSGQQIVKHMSKAESCRIDFTAVNAQSDYENFRNTIKNASIVVITGGFGGESGKKTTPIVVKIAKESGAFVIGFITKPFAFEGKKRAGNALESIDSIKREIDALFIIQNDKLLPLIDPKLGIKETFKIVDTIVFNIIRILLSKNANDLHIDFDDIRTIMAHRKVGLIGLGESRGNNAATEAIHRALNSLYDEDDLQLKNIAGAIVHFTMNPEFPYSQLSAVMKIAHGSFEKNAKIIFGTTTDENLPLDFLRVTLMVPSGYKYFEPSNNFVTNMTKFMHRRRSNGTTHGND